MSVCASNAVVFDARKVSLSRHRLVDNERWAMLNKTTFQEILNALLSQSSNLLSQHSSPTTSSTPELEQVSSVALSSSTVHEVGGGGGGGGSDVQPKRREFEFSLKTAEQTKSRRDDGNDGSASSSNFAPDRKLETSASAGRDDREVEGRCARERNDTSHSVALGASLSERRSSLLIDLEASVQKNFHFSQTNLTDISDVNGVSKKLKGVGIFIVYSSKPPPPPPPPPPPQPLHPHSDVHPHLMRTAGRGSTAVCPNQRGGTDLKKKNLKHRVGVKDEFLCETFSAVDATSPQKEKEPVNNGNNGERNLSILSKSEPQPVDASNEKKEKEEEGEKEKEEEREEDEGNEKFKEKEENMDENDGKDNKASWTINERGGTFTSTSPTNVIHPLISRNSTEFPSSFGSFDMYRSSTVYPQKSLIFVGRGGTWNCSPSVNGNQSSMADVVDSITSARDFYQKNCISDRMNSADTALAKRLTNKNRAVCDRNYFSVDTNTTLSSERRKRSAIVEGKDQGQLNVSLKAYDKVPTFDRIRDENEKKPLSLPWSRWMAMDKDVLFCIIEHVLNGGSVGLSGEICFTTSTTSTSTPAFSLTRNGSYEERPNIIQKFPFNSKASCDRLHWTAMIRSSQLEQEDSCREEIDSKDSRRTGSEAIEDNKQFQTMAEKFPYGNNRDNLHRVEKLESMLLTDANSRQNINDESISVDFSRGVGSFSFGQVENDLQVKERKRFGGGGGSYGKRNIVAFSRRRKCLRTIASDLTDVAPVFCSPMTSHRSAIDDGWLSENDNPERSGISSAKSLSSFKWKSKMMMRLGVETKSQSSFSLSDKAAD